MIDASAVRALLRTKVYQYRSRKEAAAALGIDQSYLGRMLIGKAAPGLRVLKALGLKRVMAYRVI